MASHRIELIKLYSYHLVGARKIVNPYKFGNCSRTFYRDQSTRNSRPMLTHRTTPKMRILRGFPPLLKLGHRSNLCFSVAASADDVPGIPTRAHFRPRPHYCFLFPTLLGGHSARVIERQLGEREPEKALLEMFTHSLPIFCVGFIERVTVIT